MLSLMETKTTRPAPTTTVHVKDHTGVRHYPAAQHGDWTDGCDPVAFLRARAAAHYRGHARTDYRASVTVDGAVIARVYFHDNGKTLRIVAEARS